ncbi:CpsD/CapB family tyrosine-protein kinase [Anaerosalibacter massiliensis]|uniref:non-specific protein-tyrosine kinase n=1 Tax=Anaerosalibacter massiliensis TaxID=1347392 RepID=A0A9X2MK19_9FIRM|nr:CpsD/CapB family tyrosine-protein kinase [Anaerosalibacter massiliensis]MCR2045174.1 CpsD/CapB family tyrosine-protein kinase [Anaerosalibacter massiliensis]
MKREKIITHGNPKSPVSEAFRTLRTNIQFSSIDKTLSSIVVTSSGPSEGKSTVSTNIAVTMAQSEKEVLLVDCDLRKPKIHTFFNIHNGQGLTNILAEGVSLREVAYEPEIEKNLHVLTAGPIPPNPAELLGSRRMKEFLKEVETKYHMIILDSPPVGMVTDSAILSTIADGTILVCAVGQADVDASKAAKSLLEKVNANILGVVLNKVPVKQGGYYNYNYYNYYAD